MDDHASKEIGLTTLTLKLDSHDWRDIQAAMKLRDSWRCLPDALHDDANHEGMLLAEICRGWLELQPGKQP